MTQGKSLAMNLCRSCVNLCKWFPVLFIVVIIVWSYYAYVIQLCFFSIDNIFKKIIYLILYHIFLSLFAWSYWKTIFTKIGTVPKEFRLNVTDFERLSKETTEDGQDAILNNCSAHLPVVNRTMHGSIRYCEKCCHIKPDRAHHCSVCGTCVLKMDHHCPWVNNCVNFTNYKYFVLFLGYSLLYCLYIALTNLEYFIKFWKNELKDVGSGRFHILFLLFISVMFAVSLVSLFGYHCYLVSVNRSTLESFRAPVFRMGPDKNGYNLGRFANFVEIFGDNKIKWFLPVATHNGDGVTYPMKSQHTSTYNAMGQTDPTQTSQGDGVSFPVKRIKDEENSLMNDQHEYNIEIDSNCKDSGNTDAPSSASSDVKLIME